MFAFFDITHQVMQGLGIPESSTATGLRGRIGQFTSLITRSGLRHLRQSTGSLASDLASAANACTQAACLECIDLSFTKILHAADHICVQVSPSYTSKFAASSSMLPQ